MILIPTLVGKMVINHKQVGKKHQVLKSVRNELECQERPLRRAMKTRGTSLEFSRNWKKAHDARAGWVRETAVQDRVREVIMGWVMQFYNPGLILLPVWSEVTGGVEVSKILFVFIRDDCGLCQTNINSRQTDQLGCCYVTVGKLPDSSEPWDLWSNRVIQKGYWEYQVRTCSILSMMPGT